MKAAFLLLLLAVSLQSFAIIHRISVSNFQFSPRRVNAIVGDTILWVYRSGFHTTTSTTIPAGANPWDSPMDVNTRYFIYVLQVPGLYNYICLPHAAQMQGIIRAFAASAVTINSFTVKAGLKGNPEILWRYKTGHIPKQVTLHRSYNMVDFEKIASFQNCDTVTGFTDNSIVKDVFAYYYIETINAEGDTAETDIKMYVSKPPEIIITSLSPNPVTTPHLMIQFNAAHESEIKLALQDEQGNILKQENFSASAGINNAHLHLPFEKMEPGIYYLVCLLGNKKETHKIIKP